MKSQESKQSNEGLFEFLRKLFEKLLEFLFSSKGGYSSPLGGLLGKCTNSPRAYKQTSATMKASQSNKEYDQSPDREKPANKAEKGKKDGHTPSMKP